MRNLTLLTGLVLLLCATGCVDFAEKSGIAVGFGDPEGDDGYSLDYKATPQDVFEAFRLVARDNGEVLKTDNEKMRLEGKRINKAAGEQTHDNFWGQVYDKSDDKAPRARLIVHVRYPGAATDAGRPDTARSYCFAVHRTLIALQGGEKPKDDGVMVGSEPPVQQDEAVGYFKAPREVTFEVLKQVIAENGEVSEADAAKGYVSGVRKSKLEPVGDDVRGWVYDRTEQGNSRCKVSVRVQSKKDKSPQQETAKSFIKAVREGLEKKMGKAVEEGK
jgi:hypothetical protein